MSVFEDLIDELKNENLLEDTVVDPNPADAAAREVKTAGTPSVAVAGQGVSGAQNSVAVNPLESDVPQIEKPANDLEFFRKRAVDDVSSLQMIEHVLSGVEREHMKVPPVTFDDLNAKRALHKFLQITGDIKSPEHAEAEFDLRTETEAWNFALYERDQKISVANIRRFCEDSRPVLSSQALIALARFYRNSPYSEDVRGKFDYVMTKLFSRDSGEETRKDLFARDEMIGHIATLYENWSSIALYTQKDDRAEVTLTVTRLDEFASEAETVGSFDDLLAADFFSRVRVYKEESAEMFYVPDVVGAAIQCNIAIGNRYVELIARERTAKSTEEVEEKYGEEYDQVVSDAAGKTLLLSDVLAIEDIGSDDDEEKINKPVQPKAFIASSKPKEPVRKKAGLGINLYGVNKTLAAVCVACILLGVCVYIWAEKFAGGNEDNSSVAKSVDIGDPEIKKYLRSPRQTGETLYAVAEPAFESLSEDQQKEIIVKLQRLANSRSLQKVNILNSKGRTVAFASKDRLELVSQ